ncbi:UNVERIFIED_CONTAM: Berardinelli-Seip congenital lipodystrophy 2 (seipin) [Siphonaria sp. JEL0065]|nr:Berardinelli-Seip congenital lipodystrophy 2 (seipin) [Siphonaria sp. JEL0065]
MAQQQQVVDISETITDHLTNNLLTSAGTRLIQSTLPPHVQQRIANRLAPPQQQQASKSVNAQPEADYELPPIDFDIPVTYDQARLLLQHKVIKPSRLAYRKLLFDLGAWVTADATQQSALGSIVFTVITIVLFVLAAITYAVFYAAYMPTVVTRVPAYLDFPDSSFSGSGQVNAIQFPEAVVDFTLNIKPQHTLRPDQHYTIGIDLRVPDAPSNYDYGNFMISLNLSSAVSTTSAFSSQKQSKETILMSAKRPALIAYKSYLLRSMQTLFRSVALVPGWDTEHQVVKILMVDDYVEREDLPLQKATIKIHTTSVQIFAVHIYLSAHFQGLRHFMHDWFYTTAALFIIFFMFWYAVIGLLLWRMFVSWVETKANARVMRKVTKKRINANGIEEEYETEEEVFSDDEEVQDGDMTTRVRVDLGKILKTTSTTAASSLSASASAANAAAFNEAVAATTAPTAVKKRQVYKMEALEDDVLVSSTSRNPDVGLEASPSPRSSSLSPRILQDD